MLLSLLFFANAQTITGGFGPGVFANQNAINRFGWAAHGSAEIAQLTKEVPWFGVGVEGLVGFVPKYCTTCNIVGTLRLGAGPVLRQRGGFLMVGARYSILQQRRRVRAFFMSKVNLPVGRIVLRPFMWAEGLRSTELAIGLELGFKVVDKRFIIATPRRKPTEMPKSTETSPKTTEPETPKTETPKTETPKPTTPEPEAPEPKDPPRDIE